MVGAMSSAAHDAFICMVRQCARPLQLLQSVQLDMTPDVQVQLLQRVREDPVLRVAGLPPPYRARLYRQLIAAAERQGHPLCEELLELFTACLAQPQGAEACCWMYKTYSYQAAACEPVSHSPSAKPCSSSIYQEAASEPAPHSPSAEPCSTSDVQQLLPPGTAVAKVMAGPAPASPGAGPVPAVAGCCGEPPSPWCYDHPLGDAFHSSLRQHAATLTSAMQTAPGPNRQQDGEQHGSEAGRGAVRQDGEQCGSEAASARQDMAMNGEAGHRSQQQDPLRPPADVHPAHGTAAGPAALGPRPAAGQSPGLPPGLPLGLPGHVTLHVCDNMFEGSTGCHTWEAGFALAEYVLSNPTEFRGRACLELGCGLGLLGACLQRAGAGPVALTDGDAQTLANCARNLGLNGVAAEVLPGAEQLQCCPHGQAGAAAVQCGQLWWSEVAAPSAQLRPELILGADLLYDPENIPGVVGLLLALLPPGPGGGDAPGEELPPAVAEDLAETQQAAQGHDALGPASAAGVVGPGSCSDGCRGGHAIGAGPPPPPPAAYLATTLRNEDTFRRFWVRALSRGLRLQDCTAALGACRVRFVHRPPEEGRERVVLTRITRGAAWESSA